MMSTVRASGGRSASSTRPASTICARVLARFSRPISALRAKSILAITTPLEQSFSIDYMVGSTEKFKSKSEASMRLASIPFLCSCIACVYLAGCKGDNTMPAAVRPARVVVVTPHQLGVVAEGAGRIKSRYVSPVGFEVDGRLVSRDVDVGVVVTKGQEAREAQAVDYRNK